MKAELPNLLREKGELYYKAGFYTPGEADRLYEALCNNIQWENKSILMYGRSVAEPRLTAWHGDQNAAYRYSGRDLVPKPWTPLLLRIREDVRQYCGEEFNSVLLNYYRNGRDSMGWHRDNETELGPLPVIASLSFGARRRFLLRRYKTHEHKMELLPESGSLILMRGETQTYWEHSLPKQLRVEQGRINLTFRTITTPNS